MRPLSRSSQSSDVRCAAVLSFFKAVIGFWSQEETCSACISLAVRKAELYLERHGESIMSGTCVITTTRGLILCCENRPNAPSHLPAHLRPWRYA